MGASVGFFPLEPDDREDIMPKTVKRPVAAIALRALGLRALVFLASILVAPFYAASEPVPGIDHNKTLSEQLDEDKGVIAPPPVGDEAIHVPAPNPTPGTTRVIPPPGPDGGNPPSSPSERKQKHFSDPRHLNEIFKAFWEPKRGGSVFYTRDLLRETSNDKDSGQDALTHRSVDCGSACHVVLAAVVRRPYLRPQRRHATHDPGHAGQRRAPDVADPLSEELMPGFQFCVSGQRFRPQQGPSQGGSEAP